MESLAEAGGCEGVAAGVAALPPGFVSLPVQAGKTSGSVRKKMRLKAARAFVARGAFDLLFDNGFIRYREKYAQSLVNQNEG